jgi:hypothetical protein
MLVHKNRSLAAIFVIVLGSSVAQMATAGLVNTRAQLNALLGAGQTYEDFEALNVPFAGQRDDFSGLLNSSSLFDGSGPGLVKPGVDYLAGAFFWNGNNYYGLNSQTLGDSTGWRNWQMTLDYTTPVTAMGFDLQGYQGYPQVGTVSVYGLNNALISTTNVNGGFFGWEHDAGIGSVVINAPVYDSCIMIDNHAYGIVPEPAALTLAALALCGFRAYGPRRRKA